MTLSGRKRNRIILRTGSRGQETEVNWGLRVGVHPASSFYWLAGFSPPKSPQRGGLLTNPLL